MSGIRMRAMAGVVVAVAVALASCGEKKTEKPVAKRYEAPASLDRELNVIELDSLKQMKRTHHVTRDEYWDGYGGVMANDAFEVWYPDGKVNVLQGMAMLKIADQARARTQQVFGTVPSERAVIICAGDLDVYTATTGREWWQYSRIVGDTIGIQPPTMLATRGLFFIVGPREYYEWAIGKLSKGHAPRWVEEGFASYLAGEAAVLEDMRQDIKADPLAMSTDAMESALEKEKDRQRTRQAYYNAYRMVEKIVGTHGADSMARFVLLLGENDDADAASRAAFGADFDEVVETGRTWSANP